MAEPVHDPEKHLHPLQFSLRWMLLSTAVMAVVFALLVPWLREYPTYVIRAVVVAWSVAFVIFVTMFVFVIWRFSKKRAQTLAEAGDVYHVLPIGSRFIVLWMPLFGLSCQALLAAKPTVMFLIIAGFMTDMADRGSFTLNEHPIYDKFLWTLNLSTWAFAILLPWMVHGLFVSRHVVLCEHGYVRQTKLTPWEEVLCHQWHDVPGQLWILKVLPHKFDDWPLKLDVRQSDRGAIQKLVQRVQSKYHGGSAYIPIRQRTPSATEAS